MWNSGDFKCLDCKLVTPPKAVEDDSGLGGSFGNLLCAATLVVGFSSCVCCSQSSRSTPFQSQDPPKPIPKINSNEPNLNPKVKFESRTRKV
eukprot:4283677-Amphidinium_carterae.1